MFAILRNIRILGDGSFSGTVEDVTKSADTAALLTKHRPKVRPVFVETKPSKGERIKFTAGTGEPGSPRWVAK